MTLTMRRLLPPLLVSAFGIGGFLAFVAAMSAAPWARFSETVTRSASQPTFSINIDQTISQRVGSTLDSICPYGLAGYRVSVAKTFLISRRQTGKLEREQKAASELLRSAIRDALGCEPTNGQLWLELADAEYEQAITVRRFLGLVDLSRDLEPANARMMMQRSFVMAPLLGRPEFATDRRAIAEAEQTIDLLYPADGVSLLRRIETTGRPEIAAVLLSTLPKDRRDRLSASLARARSLENEASRPRSFEFTPFGAQDR